MPTDWNTATTIRRRKDSRRSVPSSEHVARSFRERFRSKIRAALRSASTTNAAGYGQPKLKSTARSTSHLPRQHLIRKRPHEHPTQKPVKPPRTYERKLWLSGSHKKQKSWFKAPMSTTAQAAFSDDVCQVHDHNHVPDSNCASRRQQCTSCGKEVRKCERCGWSQSADSNWSKT